MDVIDDDAGLDQSWARTLPARVARELIICGVLAPMMDRYSRRQVTGHEHLEHVDGPVIFVANHCSHADTPILLRSLPARWRRRTAVAAAADYFYTRRVLSGVVSLAFCTVPLERRGGAMGAGEAVSMTRLAQTGWNLVVFAEGTRSRDGRVGCLRSGAAMLAAEHGLPIVPVHIAGTHAAMPAGRYWMRRPTGAGRSARHPIAVRFGAPIPVAPRDDRFEVMERVRVFMEGYGAQTTPDPKLALRRTAAAAKAARAGADGPPPPAPVAPARVT